MILNTSCAFVLLFIVLQKLDDHFQIPEGVDVGITAAGILALLEQRHLVAFEHRDFVFHSLNLEREVMEAFAMLVERFSPGARVVVRLDQFHLKGPQVEERQLRSCFGTLPSVFGLRFIERISEKPIRLLNAKKISICLRRLFNIVDENAD